MESVRVRERERERKRGGREGSRSSPVLQNGVKPRGTIKKRCLAHSHKTMGDMKTPDFDDLLAAFDIPDMVDPKAAIESGHDDHEGQLKHNAHHEEDSHVSSGPDVGIQQRE